MRHMLAVVVLTVLSTCPSLAAEPRWVTLFEAPNAPLREPNAGASGADMTAVMENGVLHITDTSAEKMLTYRASWNADPHGVTELEARVKLIQAAEGPCGQCLDFADGVHEDSVSFYPDRISLWYAKLDYPMNTTDAFHTYRVRISGTEVQVFVDGQLAIDGTGKFTAAAHLGRNAVQFGAGSPVDTGEGLWELMRFQTREVKPVKIEIPDIRGLDVQMGDTVVIYKGQWYPSAFRFRDGRIAVSAGSFTPAAGRWSSDGGKTWEDGPPSPANAAYEFEDGEMVSLSFWTKKLPDGKYYLEQRRSLDGWKTIADERSTLDIPLAVTCGGDGGPEEVNEGMLMDHGILRLKNGNLMATMYGNYLGDTAKSEGYGEPGFIKYRNIVVFSSDRGRTWGNPVTSGYGPEFGQEGLCEADLERAPNGDIICVMRSGGRPSIPPTPLFASRSSDEGQTWTTPEPAADKGVWPNLCLLENGVIVCTYGRPGNELVFSDDDGRTWKGAFAYGHGTYGVTSSYNSIVPVGPETVLVVYDRTAADENGLDSRDIVGTFFTVRRR